MASSQCEFTDCNFYVTVFPGGAITFQRPNPNAVLKSIKDCEDRLAALDPTDEIQKYKHDIQTHCVSLEERRIAMLEHKSDPDDERQRLLMELTKTLFSFECVRLLMIIIAVEHFFPINGPTSFDEYHELNSMFSKLMRSALEINSKLNPV